MSAAPAMPYGAAKAILSQMADWEIRIIRPAYARTFYHTARNMGVAINIRRFVKRGVELYALRRLPKLHPLRTNLHTKAHLEQLAP